MTFMPEQTPASCVALCLETEDCQAISVSSFPYGTSGSCTFFSSPVQGSNIDGPINSPYSENPGAEYTALLNLR